MSLQRELYNLSIFGESIDMHLDCLFLELEASAVAASAWVLYELTMSLTGVTLDFLTEESIFFDAFATA